MPPRILMVIPRGNVTPVFAPRPTTSANSAPVAKAPTALNQSIIGRIHNVKAGCGSCGRH